MMRMKPAAKAKSQTG